MTSAEVSPVGCAGRGLGHTVPRLDREVLNAKLEENL